MDILAQFHTARFRPGQPYDQKALPPPSFSLRVHVPKDQSQWKLDDSDLDETWSAGSAGPKTSVECHFWDIRTRTVGLGGSEGPKYDFFLERFFGKNFFLPIAGK